MSDQVYTLVFAGRTGGMTDVVIQKAVQAAGGKILASGFYNGERQIEFSVPAEHARALVAGLSRFGLEAKARVH